MTWPPTCSRRSAGAGLVLPPAALPEFLELGRDSRIAPVLTDLVGERGRWLVDLDEDWAIFLPRGTRARDVAALRRVDPVAARELVVAEWADASAGDRARLLDALATGLGVDDVPFLESALSDRSEAVGVRAATLLTRLCGRLPLDQQPPFGERAITRAQPLVRLVRQGLLRSPALEVVAPESLDQSARGDLLSGPEPGFRKGQRAWWLEQVIQRAPLSLWENEFGRSPAELVALPVVGDFARELHPGWRAAAWAQQNLAWARALLAVPDAPVDPSLVGVLPAAEQATVAVPRPRLGGGRGRRGPPAAHRDRRAVAVRPRHGGRRLRRAPARHRAGAGVDAGPPARRAAAAGPRHRSPSRPSRLAPRARTGPTSRPGRSASTIPGGRSSPPCPRPCRCVPASTTSSEGVTRDRLPGQSRRPRASCCGPTRSSSSPTSSPHWRRPTTARARRPGCSRPRRS